MLRSIPRASCWPSVRTTSIITLRGSKTSGVGTCSSSPPGRRNHLFHAIKISMPMTCRRNLQSYKRRISARSALRRICCVELRSCLEKTTNKKECKVRHLSQLPQIQMRYSGVGICFWKIRTGKMQILILIKCLISTRSVRKHTWESCLHS